MGRPKTSAGVPFRARRISSNLTRIQAVHVQGSARARDENNDNDKGCTLC